MTTGTKERVEKYLDEAVSVIYITVVICLAYFCLTSAATANQVQYQPSSHDDVVDQRLTRVETIQEDRSKLLDEAAKKIETLQGQENDLDKKVEGIKSSVENILKMLYLISAGLGSMLVDRAMFTLKKAWHKGK